MIDQLEKQIQFVAEARHLAQKASDLKTKARVKWEAENSLIINLAAVAAQSALDAEAELRDLTLLAYAETGNKTPAPGVGICEVTTLEYDPKIAFDWAIEHTIALKLDVIAFVKIAKVSPPDFVEVTTKPQATISRNLDEIFIKEEE